jgi:hypothetical protein
LGKVEGMAGMASCGMVRQGWARHGMAGEEVLKMLQEYDVWVRKEGHFTVWAESKTEAKEMIADMDGEDLDKYAEWDEPEISCFM